MTGELPPAIALRATMRALNLWICEKMTNFVSETTKHRLSTQNPMKDGRNIKH